MADRSTTISSRPGSPVGPLPGGVGVYLIACAVLGGGTQVGFLGDAVLQLGAVPLLLAVIWRLVDVPQDLGRRRARLALLACLASVGLLSLQLIPLPPFIWMQLPGRDGFLEALRAAGLEIGWLPLSVAPRSTWLGLLSLLPPMTVFLSVILLDHEERRRLVGAILVVGLIGVGLGLAQVAQGPASPLRFYAFTNPTEAVGFFANRNHFAAHLYCLLLLTAASLITALSDLSGTRRMPPRRSRARMIAPVILYAAALAALVLAQAVARSRAGMGLTIVAMIGALAMAYLVPAGTDDASPASPRPGRARAPGRILIAVIAVALLIAAQLALHRIQARLASEAAVDARVPFARNTIEAALAYMPYGSGLGSFVPVYQRFEKATDNVSDVYANHAHNDFLELWLETGVIGLAAMAIFALWLAVSAVRVWRRGLPGARYSDNLLAAASALSLALLLAHSMVDYPLRATALMVYFAFAAGMIVAPAGARQPLVTVSGAAAARDTEERPASGPSRPFVPAQRPPNDWPDAWRASPRRRNDDM